MGEKQFKIRDLRKKDQFILDDAYLNGYARLCGWQATLVYISLCRHADINQIAFPSLNLIADELGVSRNTVIRGIKALKEWGVIEVIANTRDDGGQSVNTYTLLDKSEWKAKPQLTTDTPTSSPQIPPQSLTDTPPVPDVDTILKDAQKKDAQKKEKERVKEKEKPKDRSLTVVSSQSLSKYSALEDLGEQEFEEIAQKYQVPRSFVLSKMDDMALWAGSRPGNGKLRGRNWKLTLMKFVKDDAIKIHERRMGDPTKRAVDARNL